MQFYQIYVVYDDKLRSEDLVARAYLPTVLYRECRHVLGTYNVIPHVFDRSSPLAKYITTERKPIAPSEWDEVHVIAEQELAKASVYVLDVTPGMRVGPLNVAVRWKGHRPDFLDISTVPVISERVVAAWQAAGITGFSAYGVAISPMSGKQPISGDYFEVLANSSASLSDAANWNAGGLCPVCGTALSPSFDGLVINENTWSGDDVICVKNTTLITERARLALVDTGISGVHFVPAERISGGIGKPTMTQVLADLEFDRQRKERQKIT